MSGSVEQILEQHKPSFDRLPSINAFDKVCQNTTIQVYIQYINCHHFHHLCYVMMYIISYQASKSNEMLSGLRYFEHSLKDNGRGKPKQAFSWGAIDMSSVARCFITLCTQAVNVFTSESRLVEVTSPCYVLGK